MCGDRFSSSRNLTRAAGADALGQGFGGVVQGGRDVLELQVGVLGDDLVSGHPAR
jgi:hypothetical protein